MKAQRISRRAALKQTGMLVGVSLASPSIIQADAATPRAASAKSSDPFIFCLNTATIRGKKLGLVKEIEVAAQTGYHGIEPWISSIDDYTKSGGSLKDLRKRLDDFGLTVQSAIGFAEWLVEDEARRAKGVERA